MTVQTHTENSVMTVFVDGEINTLTTPELATHLSELQGLSLLILDLERVPYVSSAGLRLFLSCLRTLKAAGGDLHIRNCNPFVMEIFQSVGYERILHLEEKP